MTRINTFATDIGTHFPLFHRHPHRRLLLRDPRRRRTSRDPMNCPLCHSSRIEVYRTRDGDDREILRERRCKACHHRWETIELPTMLLKKIPRATNSTSGANPSS